MATAKQITEYTKVCMRKGVQPKDLNSMTEKEAREEIGRVFSLIPKASEAQINTLRDAIQELVDMGVKGVKMPPQKFFDGLNQQHASKWIQDSLALKGQNAHIAPPSKQQMDELLDMYLCPVIPWEAVSITREEEIDTFDEEGIRVRRVIHIDDVVNLSKEFIYNGDGSPMMVISTDGKAKPAFRFRTRDEFEEAIKKNLKQADAAKLIKEYKGEFIRWERSRITDGQISEIQKLERQLANMSSPKAIEPVTTGDMPFTDEDAPFAFETASRTTKSEKWNPQAFNPTPLHQLKLMSKDEANQYMRQLHSERDYADHWKFAPGQYAVEFTNRKDYEGVLRTQRAKIVRSEWVNKKGYIEFMDESTFEDVRTASTTEQWREQEFVRINNLLFQMQAVGGYNTEELRDEAANTFFSFKVRTEGGNGVADAGASEEKIHELRGKIRELMIKLIKDEYITFNGMMDMCEKSELAQEIFLAIE